MVIMTSQQMIPLAPFLYLMVDIMTSKIRLKLMGERKIWNKDKIPALSDQSNV